MPPMLKVGFTGTQKGMTGLQWCEVWVLLHEELAVAELHHGDCEGADAQAHSLVKQMGLCVIIHPPTNKKHRAFCKGADELREEKDYLVRNRDIVDETDILIATPFEKAAKLRSGTWSTIRYAMKLGRQIYIIFPDGCRESILRCAA